MFRSLIILLSFSKSVISKDVSEVPENIKNLLADQTEADKVYLVSDPNDDAEMFTLRSENSSTGEGTLTVHSVPVKYTDSKGDLQFIDTSMKALDPSEIARGYSYRNAANAFDVEYGITADKGINFNNAFTIGALIQKSTITNSRSAEEGIKADAEEIIDSKRNFQRKNQKSPWNPAGSGAFSDSRARPRPMDPEPNLGFSSGFRLAEQPYLPIRWFCQPSFCIFGAPS